MFGSPLVRRMALREIVHTPESENRDIVRTPTNLELGSTVLTPSPDEQVIRQRGRRKVQQVTKLQVGRSEFFDHTPPRIPVTPTKSPRKNPLKTSTPIRTSPRKRLQLGTSLSPSVGSPNKSRQSLSFSFTPKRNRIGTGRNLSVPNVVKSLRGLSHDQLVGLLEDLMTDHVDMVEEVCDRLPSPDLKPLEERLNYLKRNIFQSFPSSKLLGSNRDAFCYRRVFTHISAFKKECLDQGRALVASEQWHAMIEYVVLAWSYIRLLPDWDNAAHNKMKAQCFTGLAGLCMQAIKCAPLDQNDYCQLKHTLADLRRDCPEMNMCYNYAAGFAAS